MSIRLRTRCLADADDAARARAVLDDDRRPERSGEPLGDIAADQVGRPAGRLRDDDPDGTRRPRRPCGERRIAERCDDEARCNREQGEETVCDGGPSGRASGSANCTGHAARTRRRDRGRSAKQRATVRAGRLRRPH
jgi:hypothetical protein